MAPVRTPIKCNHFEKARQTVQKPWLIICYEEACGWEKKGCDCTSVRPGTFSSANYFSCPALRPWVIAQSNWSQCKQRCCHLLKSMKSCSARVMWKISHYGLIFVKFIMKSLICLWHIICLRGTAKMSTILLRAMTGICLITFFVLFFSKIFWKFNF